MNHTSKVRKHISTVLIFSLLSLYAGPALAQNDPAFSTDLPDEKELQPDLPKDASWADCHIMGKRHGETIGTGGSMAGGLAGGLLLGLIGTGIAVLAQSESSPPAEYLFEMEEKGGDCQYAYIEAFNSQSVSKKRKAALTGGLIGTAILVVLVVSASGD